MSDPGLEGQTEPVEQRDDGMINLIMLGRIYDVLMMLLVEQNPEAANDLLEIHASGALMGTQPSFNGMFVADAVNGSPGDEVNSTEEPTAPS